MREQEGGAQPEKTRREAERDRPSENAGSREGDSAQSAGTAPRAQSLGRDQSGVFVNSPAANTAYSPEFLMRGFPSGFPLFDGASRGFTALGAIDLSTVDHVEFYKGPSAMLFGKALGGYGSAPNYIRKAPTKESFAEISSTVAAFAVRRVKVDVNTPLFEQDNFLFRMTGSAQTEGSFVNFVRSRSFDIAPMIAFTADNGDRLTLRAEHNAGRLVYRDGVPADPIFLRIPREFYAGIPVNENETPFYDELTLTHEHTINERWKFSTVVDYFLYTTHYGWFSSWEYDGFRSIDFGQPARARIANRSFDAQLRLNGQFDTGALSHTVFLGLEHWDYFFGYTHRISQNALAPLDIFSPIYPLGINYVGASWANGNARAWTQSIYTQDLIDITPQWRILIGGRYDLLAQRERVFDPLGALTGEQTFSLSKGIKGYFNPRAGVLFRPDNATQIFAAFGQSLVPNTGVRVRSGSAPAPQQDTQYEIGAKRDFLDGKASFEVGLFDVTRNNVAIPDPANPSGFYSIVTGQQHSHGVEVNVGAEILPNLQVNGVATFLHAVVTKDANAPSQAGSDLLGAPRRVYSINGTYTFDAGDLKGLELGASYYYASQTEATLPNTPGFTLPPQQMLGVSLSYSFKDNLKLEINATNLTDRPNWTSNGALYRGEPRSVSASLTYRY
ncbi:MAG: TonB-dependent receptor [Methylocystis sp.]|nr:TonB-dependent receptor [Methylocystis sp.]